MPDSDDSNCIHGNVGFSSCIIKPIIAILLILSLLKFTKKLSVLEMSTNIYWNLDCSYCDYDHDCEVVVRGSLAAGGRIVTMGQLLFAPSAWVYSTLHP